MNSPAPTILSFEHSAWLVILAVSLATMMVVLALRRLIARPGGLASGILLTLPLGLPVVAAVIYAGALLPEIVILRPAGPALLSRSTDFIDLVWVSDPSSKTGTLYAIFSAGRWFTLAAAAVALVMLVRRLLGYVALRRLLARCRPPRGGEYALVDRLGRLAAENGLERAPELVVLPGSAPVALTAAGRRTRVVVSEGLLGALDNTEMAAVLAHEVAHAAARDLPLLSVAGVLRDLMVWNPLAHIALRRLRHDREVEADRRAAALIGDPLAVASGLVRMCELTLRGPAPRCAGAVGFIRGNGRIHRRVAHLLALADGPIHSERPSKTPHLIAALVAVVLGLQVGARVAGDAGAQVVVGWRNGTSSGSVWRPGAPQWEPKKRPLDTTKKLSARRQAQLAARRVQLRQLADGPVVVRRRNFDEYMRALAMLAAQRGVSPERVPTSAAESWTTAPVLSGGRDGSLEVYRMTRGS